MSTDNFFLRIYDFLVGRKWLAGLVAAAIALACGLLAARMHFEEDITRFLPADEQSARYSEAYDALGKKNNIAVIFSGRNENETDEYAIQEAMYAFSDAFDEADTAKLVKERQITVDQEAVFDMMEAVTTSFPLYMTEEDYSRIDSLLSIPGYVSRELAEDKESLMFPSGDMVVRYIQSDPLHLFSPVLQRLRASAANSNYEIIDDCIFTSDGKGLAFLTSPFGMSESGMNSKVAELVGTVSEKVGAQFPDVEINAVGAPLIAVTNARQIKRDSVLAISIALLLIGLLLAFSYKRLQDIVWIVVSIAFGWLFAVGVMSLVRDSMSIIVLGVASVIIGIAVNYPLHYLDGFKAGVTPRMNLREMVAPLLIGNITTVAAFLCLVGLDAVAMKDLGLFGSLMLAGTILFVLIFLPVFAKPRDPASRTLELGRLLPEKVPSSIWLFLAVMALTGVMYVLSKRTTFDSEMQHINYMTSSQREGLKLLESGLEQEGFSRIYAIAEGSTLEEALSNNDALQDRLEALGNRISFVKGTGRFTPGTGRQRERIERWNGFWEGRREALVAGLLSESRKVGFSDDAFEPFLDLLENEPEVQSLDSLAPSIRSFDGTYVLQDEGKYRIVNQVFYKGEGLKQDLKTEGSLVFDTGDISNQLVKVLSDSFDKIGLICSLVVFIFLCLSFRRLELSLLAFFPLVVSWFWILGIMGLCDIRFNIVNIILATFIFGQGDDYTIFITEGLIYEYAYGKKRLATYKNSIFHSAIIMFIGIGALVLAKHPAMKSLGLVTVIGMFIVVLMAYYLPPLVFRWLTCHKGVKRDVPITLKRLLYSFVAIIGFVLFMFLFVYPYTFLHFLGKDSEEKKTSYHRFLQKVSSRLIRMVPGVKFRMSDPTGGQGTMDFSKPAVIIANHQSHLDLACLMALTPKMVFFTNGWVWKNPIYGYVIRKAEFYPIADGLEKNLDRIKDLVSRGYSLCVFPEGTRTRDGRIGRFHKGAFYVACELSLDVVPVFLHGADHVLPKTDFMLREGTISMEVGSRITPRPDYRSMTKEMHLLYLDYFAGMKKRLETPEYLSRYVRYKYLYKGAGVEADCRKALSSIGSVDYLRETGDGPERFEIHGCGQGEYSLIYALMHPETEVEAYDPDEENIMLASCCSNLPANLHYHIETE